MEIKYKTSGRGDILYKFINKLKNDEHLLRLLYYNPLDSNGNYIEFTDSNLPNITDMPEDERDLITYDLIRTTQKSDDIVENKKNVIFVYYGKSRPKYNNHTLVDREIVFLILSHNDFSFAQRIEEICDRLDTLFVNKNIAGIGKTGIGNSFPREAPKEYLAYEQIYTITDKRV
ncbi:hypothetical protein QOK74_08500 [Staphylococcus saprophyticus]|uniref:hypothetical protein n=1 Tax=Staphylococcus saprophyticus TaxID=29385 RepID=UPI0024C41450|nr:hypothetical protein [Staphylococcus saprophyticus]MDK1672912.1 hypothetical protein [Staphylococcus saprophyticus]